MTNMGINVRHAQDADIGPIFELYKSVSRHIGGIARHEDEITLDYIQSNYNKAKTSGVCFVIEHPEKANVLLASIHCYKLEPRVFSHILSELTVVVHPDYHGRGLGKTLFCALLEYVENHRKDILRIELIARESNQKAIELYKKLGFLVEGKLEKRIASSPGVFEADMPMAWFNKNYRSDV